MSANAAGEQPTRWHLAAVAGLSGGMLAFEILLLRLFEFSHWHHFAGLAIALALLGLGAAGTTLALLGERAVRWGDAWFLGGLLTMALGLLLTLAVQSHVALQRLAPGGLLAIPLPVEEPPRHWPRLLQTLKAALERQGAEPASERVAALRSLQAHLLLASREPLETQDLETLRRFAGEWQFDLDWLPGLSEDEANRYHQTEEPVFYQSARAILTGERDLPDDVLRFATGTATQDQPYLWRSLRWERAPELLRSLGARGMAYLDWSLIFSLASLVVVSLLAFILILAPMGRLPRIAPPFSRLSLAAYFACLGFGYMLVEIAVFQRSLLLTDQPVLAATLVFSAFLLGSGVGSLSAPETRDRRALVRTPFASAE